MARVKTYRYIVDKLNNDSSERIKKALQHVNEIKSITVDPSSGMVELVATRDLETELKLACDIAGASFRVKMKRGIFS